MPTRYGDVVVAHPIDLRQGTWVGAAAGKAAHDAEMGKFRGYRPAPDGRPVLLVPLAVETFGRFGKHASLELRRIARARACRPDAQASVDPAAVYRGALLRWRRTCQYTYNWGMHRCWRIPWGRAPSAALTSLPMR